MEEIYEFGAYKLSTSERGLWCREKKIEPSARYFDLLSCFVKNAGQLITADLLRREVWETENVEDKTIKNTVAELRRMLEDGDPDTGFIETVPTKGYQFVCPVVIPTKMQDVDKNGLGMKELTVTDQPTTEVLNGNRHEPIIYPGVGWEGLVLTVGVVGVESQLPEATPSQFDRGFREVVRKFHPEHRAGIFFEFAQRAAPNLLGREQTTWLDWVEGEYWGYCDALDYYGNIDANKELEMAVNLAPYWNERAFWTEGRERLRQALAHQQSENISDVKARALIWYGHLCYHLDDYKTAKESLSQGAAMCKKVGDELNYAHALFLLGSVAEVEGNYPEAKIFHDRSIEAGEKIKAHQYMGGAYRGLASTALMEGDVLKAKDLYYEGLAEYELAEDHRCVANCYSRLSVVALAQKDIPQARLMWEKSNDPRFGIPGRQSIALAEFNKGMIEEVAGRPEAALPAFQKSFFLRHQIGEKRGTAKAMEAVARVGWKMGQEKQSARILGAAAALRASASAPMSPTEKRKYQDLITDLRGKYPKEYEEGSQRVLEEIIPVV